MLLKVTLMIAAALKGTNYIINPFHSLDLPQKSGHPYVADVIISDGESNDSSNPPDEASIYFTTVKHNNAVIFVVKVKKSLPVEFSRNNPSDVIEMLVYAQYLLTIYQQAKITEVLTDGANWYCMSLQRNESGSGYMKLLKYYCFLSTSPLEVVGMIPDLMKI